MRGPVGGAKDKGLLDGPEEGCVLGPGDGSELGSETSMLGSSEGSSATVGSWEMVGSVVGDGPVNRTVGANRNKKESKFVKRERAMVSCVRQRRGEGTDRRSNSSQQFVTVPSATTRWCD